MQSRESSLGLFLLGVDVVVGALVVVGLAATAISLRVSARAHQGWKVFAPPSRRAGGRKSVALRADP
jgi:hypothetical protein